MKTFWLKFSVKGGPAVLDKAEILPLSCPKCGQTTEKPVPWVQENTFYACPCCGNFVLIDKDAATKALAELQRPSH
jgi:hypothetical protein